MYDCRVTDSIVKSFSSWPSMRFQPAWCHRHHRQRLLSLPKGGLRRAYRAAREASAEWVGRCGRSRLADPEVLLVEEERSARACRVVLLTEVSVERWSRCRAAASPLPSATGAAPTDRGSSELSEASGVRPQVEQGNCRSHRREMRIEAK